ncbi:MAG: polysaccharide deacetylase family protein [Ilumatobacteraceae bacterium]
MTHTAAPAGGRRSTARRAVKALSLAADRVLARSGGITILIYHRVGSDSGSEVDLDLAVFRAQLDYLAAHADVLPLDDAVTALSTGALSTDHQSAGAPSPSSLSPRTSSPAGPTASRRPQVVITFDDGTTDFAEHAVPALVAAGLPATLYVATHFVDTGTAFPWGAPPASWQSLRDAASTGLVTIGSHTHSHWLLDRADHATVTDDLDRSIDLIAQHIGTAPRHFAYPKAVLGSTATEAAVRARFASAALARNRPNRPATTDLHRLWRTPVQRSDTAAHFAAKAAGGMRLEGTLRDLAARWTYRGQTQ